MSIRLKVGTSSEPSSRFSSPIPPSLPLPCSLTLPSLTKNVADQKTREDWRAKARAREEMGSVSPWG